MEVSKTIKITVTYSDDPTIGDVNDWAVVDEMIMETVQEQLPESVYVDNDDEKTNEDNPEVEVKLTWAEVNID